MNDRPEIVIIDTCPPWMDGIAAWLVGAGYVCHKHLIAQDIVDGAHFTPPSPDQIYDCGFRATFAKCARVSALPHTGSSLYNVCVILQT